MTVERSPADAVTHDIQQPSPPEAVVSEKTARRVFDKMMQGTADLGFRSSAERERFVADAVGTAIKRHEEGVASILAAPRPGKKQRKLESQLVDLGKDAFGNPIKAYERPLSKTKLRAMRRRAAAKANWTVEDARLAVKLRERLDLLRLHPEWDRRLVEAYFAGGAAETMRLLEGGMYTVAEVETLSGGCERPIRNACTDAAMEIVDQSSAVFGDWKTATAPPPASTPLVNPFRVMRDAVNGRRR